MNPPYGATHGHCRELIALRRDLEALERRYMEDLARLQAALDAERTARQALSNEMQWRQFAGVA